MYCNFPLSLPSTPPPPSSPSTLGPLLDEMIPVLHSVAEANASYESDGVAKQEDEQMGIFQILDKLEEAVDALLNTSRNLLDVHCAQNHFLLNKI